jgi:hypothetical protein
MDMTAAALLTSIARMRAYLDARTGWRRARLVARALELASEHSRSPNETRTRLIYELEAGLPRPLVNREVWSRDGRLLGIADLLDPEAGLVGEFDGADHRSARRHTDDIRREEAFRRHGLEMFRVTGLDLRDPARVVERIHVHRARARWLPPQRRAWTMEPPRVVGGPVARRVPGRAGLPPGAVPPGCVSLGSVGALLRSAALSRVLACRT